MSSFEEVYQKAISLLSRRQHSVFELKQKLLKRKFPPVVVDSVIEKLLEQKYLNDEEYARMVVRYYFHKGNYYIRQKLKYARVESSIIEVVLPDMEDELKRCLEVAQRKKAILAKRNPSTEKQTKEKLYRFLASRGFTPVTIQKTIALLLESGLL
ncbi:MAG: regulatory protein RecX [Candidatus Hydrogenedentota bacterium]|nr:MAG: regulatory protein RecX [Candidatus Hydrogenedentota bacterium]